MDNTLDAWGKFIYYSSKNTVFNKNPYVPEAKLELDKATKECYDMIDILFEELSTGTCNCDSDNGHKDS